MTFVKSCCGNDSVYTHNMYTCSFKLKFNKFFIIPIKGPQGAIYKGTVTQYTLTCIINVCLCMYKVFLVFSQQYCGCTVKLKLASQYFSLSDKKSSILIKNIHVSAQMSLANNIVQTIYHLMI